jgi:hypothetical protein
LQAALVEEQTLAVVVVLVGIELQLVLVSLAERPTPLQWVLVGRVAFQQGQLIKALLVAIPFSLLSLLLVEAVVATPLLLVLLTGLLVVLEVVVVL